MYITLIIIGVLLFLLGVGITWAVFSTKLTAAQTRAELLEEARTKMAETFQALSGESLKSNSKVFADMAKDSLRPLEDSLQRYELKINELEKTRARAYGNLETQIRALMEAQQTLQKETGNLVTALRRPEVRGRWGEVTLKRVVELAGMTAYCDYTEQVSVKTQDGLLRPDMIVHLPAEREIVVDSKVSLDAYLDALNSGTDEERKSCMRRHAQHVRKHMRSLSSKAYWDQFKQAPEFVVMFIPGDSFLSAAVEEDPLVIENGMEEKVIIATPTTLIALLRAIAYGWRQEQVAKNAQEIASLGKELYDRFQPFLEHVNKTGNYLSQAVVAFNKMIMSLERRVMVSVRKFKELGSVGDKDLSGTRQVEQIPMKTQETEQETEEDTVAACD